MKPVNAPVLAERRLPRATPPPPPGAPAGLLRRALGALRLGDKVAAVATPTARVLRLDCIDPETKKLRPESGCAKRQRRWNGEA